MASKTTSFKIDSLFTYQDYGLGVSSKDRMMFSVPMLAIYADVSIDQMPFSSVYIKFNDKIDWITYVNFQKDFIALNGQTPSFLARNEKLAPPVTDN